MIEIETESESEREKPQFHYYYYLHEINAILYRPTANRQPPFNEYIYFYNMQHLKCK